MNACGLVAGMSLCPVHSWAPVCPDPLCIHSCPCPPAHRHLLPGVRPKWDEVSCWHWWGLVGTPSPGHLLQSPNTLTKGGKGAKGTPGVPSIIPVSQSPWIPRLGVSFHYTFRLL